ncbi:hypothetical protein QG37_00560 [Candidozyma auris]|uniref:Uncharacterized protein n=1 Tax=Candidozyma auris TaxID=498019 RepID=A0A0L0P8F3_CANAR|nr:hypothetical protein QG37_00560 [[Candida] auris]
MCYIIRGLDAQCVCISTQAKLQNKKKFEKKKKKKKKKKKNL